MDRYLVCFSGGLDSVTLAAKLKRDRHCVSGVFFNWAQTNYEPENQAVAYFEEKLDINVYRANLSDWVMALETECIDFSPIQLPRNAMFVLASLPYAIEIKADWIALGSNADDTSVPDGSKEFVRDVNCLLETTSQPSRLKAPFLEENLGKSEVFELAKSLLSGDVKRTWSCWNSKGKPCGVCSACTLRRAACEDDEL